ncbi:MAG: flagellar biosynthesis protein FlhF [Arcobacteraceae bacterium]|nr:flagellar biosynthesis protein FlhF [Arcobacteraceae bacterium]
MKTLSFLGETPTIALRKAQIHCGEDAIVIYTKKISTKAKDNVDMYEILVGLEDESQNTVEQQTISSNSVQDSKTENALKAQVYDFKAQILKMQESIDNVQKTIWAPKSQLFDLDIPPEFIDMYSLFELNEFDEEMIYTIFKKTIKQLPMAFKSNTNKVNDFFKLILRRLIPIKYEVPLQTNQKKIMMFVGPTGVGKTTTIAKLAARFAYKMPINYKVGIITLDSFRVGAIEQLKAYTNIMRLPLEVVKRTEDLSEAISRLKDCHYILIDTAGSSQYDMDKIELISQYQQNLDENILIEKTLVLPANIKTSDLHEIYNKYAVLGINNLNFTKLDETKSFGSLMSFTHKSKKSISFLSIGQNVPDDLIVADASFLINCFMDRKCSRDKIV